MRLLWRSEWEESRFIGDFRVALPLGEECSTHRLGAAAVSFATGHVWETTAEAATQIYQEVAGEREIAV